MNLTDLMLNRVDALYRCDQQGRMVSINQWDGGVPPRLHLMRTADGVISRFRADVPDDLASRFEELCRREPVGELSRKLPAHYDEYVELLSSHAPIEGFGAGPAYMFTRDVPTTASPIAIDDTNAYLLRGGFEAWLPDVPHRHPFMVVVEGEHAVSLCASVRISDAVHCAGVETRAEYSRRAHAVNVVAGWAHAVRLLGATPFYSTSWDNLASQGVAARLGLSLVGVDFSIT